MSNLVARRDDPRTFGARATRRGMPLESSPSTYKERSTGAWVCEEDPEEDPESESSPPAGEDPAPPPGPPPGPPAEGAHLEAGAPSACEGCLSWTLTTQRMTPSAGTRGVAANWRGHCFKAALTRAASSRDLATVSERGARHRGHVRLLEEVAPPWEGDVVVGLGSVESVEERADRRAQAPSHDRRHASWTRAGRATRAWQAHGRLAAEGTRHGSWSPSWLWCWGNPSSSKGSRQMQHVSGAASSSSSSSSNI
mmetsp:Transcript_9322/g.30296  ORF Transcript_9322/g.30296 Transcript_9322/m.30296 type:complete len:253 (+) Transcript_9322:936-1694(+)